MSDAFEFEHFGDLTGGLPESDDDGDGRTNLEEYLADTDPNDASSFAVISSIGKSGGMVIVTVPDTSGARSYTLYKSDDLGLLDPWFPIDGPVAGNGGDLVLNDSGSMMTRRFYKVGVALP